MRLLSLVLRSRNNDYIYAAAPIASRVVLAHHPRTCPSFRFDWQVQSERKSSECRLSIRRAQSLLEILYPLLPQPPENLPSDPLSRT